MRPPWKSTWLVALICVAGLYLVARHIGTPRPQFGSGYRVCHAQMSNFTEAIEQYRMEERKLPGSLHELTEPHGRTLHRFIDRIPLDPWGNPYEYRVLDPDSYELRSHGEDGLPDTEDDALHPRSSQDEN